MNVEKMISIFERVLIEHPFLDMPYDFGTLRSRRATHRIVERESLSVSICYEKNPMGAVHNHWKHEHCDRPHFQT